MPTDADLNPAASLVSEAENTFAGKEEKISGKEVEKGE
jgi:hypothetical protein